MPVYRLPEEVAFPPPTEAEPSGLLAVGGDLSPERLLTAYANGIFPWYSEDEPILWFSPDPRFVLRPSALRVSRSLRKRVRRGDYRVTLDTAFADVIARCQATPRPGQAGTWITPEMRDAYIALHELGFAHSVEAWRGEELVGGLYGVGLGGLFSGESMFAHAPDASKVAFVWLVRQLERWGVALIDCQIQTDHLERFGAEDLDRDAFLDALPDLVRPPYGRGRWRFDPDLDPLQSAPPPDDAPR